MSVAVEVENADTGRIHCVFGVEVCLSNKRMKELVGLTVNGKEMEAFRMLLRRAEIISAAPPNGNGHNGNNGHRAKKPSKQAATARVSSRSILFCRA